jgi:D-alanyl-D-alanine dipeptidase
VDRALSAAPGPIPLLAPTDGWRDVPIEPVDEPLVAVADIGPRVHDDPRYHAMGLPGAVPRGWVREGVAERLASVGGALPDGRSLVVWDGYRTLETQAALYYGYLEELAMVHHDWPGEALEVAASRYVTPPSRALSAPPPHLTGGAVDLTLGDGDGRPLDLGTGFDAFVPEAAARALEGTPGQVRDLRRTLYWAMAGQGFTAYLEEWWHFDYGDQFWGLATSRAACYAAARGPQ